jgi:superfamily I DNA/RNA helicase
VGRDPLLESLNPEQRRAVTTVRGPLLVLAGAGTGKTRVVTSRIAHLLRTGVPPEAIVAVTFTNKAAGEMRDRLTALVGRRTDLSALVVSTFHSLCVRILREGGEAVGVPPDFTIADQGEQAGVVRKAARHVRAAVGLKPEECLRRISRLKCAGVTPAAAALRATEEAEQTLASVYRRYEEALRGMHAVDFDDLLLRATALLEGDAPAAQAWRERVGHLLVDEFQDTNAVQYRLAQALAAPQDNLCVVGDDDQSIYGWRGAVAAHILDFHKRYPAATVVRLEENYRSTTTILDAANGLIRNNESRREKALWSRLGEGRRIRVLAAEDQNDEAERIAAEIRRLVKGEGTKAADIAVILRTNAQTRPFEEELRAEGIPCVVVGGRAFFDRKEVRDVLSYLGAVANPRNDAALLRIVNTPARGLGDRSVEALAARARATGRPLQAFLSGAGEVPGLTAKARAAAEDLGRRLRAWRKAAHAGETTGLVGRIIEETRYAEEIAHLYDNPLEQASRLNQALEVDESLRRYLARDPRGGLAGFVREAALLGKDEESRSAAADAVRLITVHSAKGLEFPVVYVAGLEEGLLPHRNAEEEGTIEEERRLLYVALTRARRRLTLSYCRERVTRGKGAARSPSRFLAEIPPACLERLDEASTEEEARDAIRAIRDRLAERASS